MSHGPVTCEDCDEEYEPNSRRPHVCKPMPVESLKSLVEGMIEEALVEERARAGRRIRKLANERYTTRNETHFMLLDLADAIERDEDPSADGLGEVSKR